MQWQFDETDPLVQFKLRTLKVAFPAASAIVFGDIYQVEGSYTRACVDYGCERALLIDSLETPCWLELRLRYPMIDFRKGDFSNPFFMQSIPDAFDVGVAFDILLHQPPLLSTLHLLLAKVQRRFCVVQPMLREQRFTNSLVYLPGSADVVALHPLGADDAEYRVFDVRGVNQGNWIWGMTRSFLTAVLEGEGFAIRHQEEFGELPNPNWFWWGCVAERAGENPRHWSYPRSLGGLYTPDVSGA